MSSRPSLLRIKLAKSPRPLRKPRRRNNYCNSFRAYTDSSRANMPLGGRRRTPADVTHPPLYDSRETNLTASSRAEFLVRTLSRATIGNERTTIQSRRLVPRACKVARLPRYLGARTFRLSKWLRHFFHRKEFRRKERGTITVGRCVFFVSWESQGGGANFARAIVKQRTPTNYFITNINII